MPLGSSSEAPVIQPGPSMASSRFLRKRGCDQWRAIRAPRTCAARMAWLVLVPPFIGSPRQPLAVEPHILPAPAVEGAADHRAAARVRPAPVMSAPRVLSSGPVLPAGAQYHAPAEAALTD